MKHQSWLGMAHYDAIGRVTELQQPGDIGPRERRKRVAKRLEQSPKSVGEGVRLSAKRSTCRGMTTTRDAPFSLVPIQLHEAAVELVESLDGTPVHGGREAVA